MTCLLLSLLMVFIFFCRNFINSNWTQQVIQGQQLIRHGQRGSSHLYRYQLLPYRQTSHMKCIETSYEIYIILLLYIIDTCITLLTVLTDWNIIMYFVLQRLPSVLYMINLWYNLSCFSNLFSLYFHMFIWLSSSTTLYIVSW